MNGIMKHLLEQVIVLMLRAYQHYLNAKYGECIGSTLYGKGDTLGFDSIPEITYIDGVKALDDRIVIVTEETDEDTLKALPDNTNPDVQPLILISDPIDRSKFLVKYLKVLFAKYQAENLDKPVDLLESVTIQFLLEKYGSLELWNEHCGSPAAVTGATSAITCVKKGKIIFTIIANYITEYFYIACDAGIYKYSMVEAAKTKVSLDKIFKGANAFSFVQMNDADVKQCKSFTTFMGKAGYKENLVDSKFFGEEDIIAYLREDEPGGPTRPLYLSDLQTLSDALGFVVYNGEKITEWAHALGFVKFARNYDGSRALNIYEIVIERAWSKNGIMMSTHPAYSIFNQRNGTHYIDMNKLKDYDSPSHYRSMLLITTQGNNYINLVMRQRGYRSISSCL